VALDRLVAQAASGLPPLDDVDVGPLIAAHHAQAIHDDRVRLLTDVVVHSKQHFVWTLHTH
jgi:hypothetical protein